MEKDLYLGLVKLFCRKEVGAYCKHDVHYTPTYITHSWFPWGKRQDLLLYVSGGAAGAKKPAQVLDILYMYVHGQITKCFKQDHTLHETRTIIVIIFRFKLLYDIIGS